MRNNTEQKTVRVIQAAAKETEIGKFVAFARADETNEYKEIELGVLPNYKAQEVTRITGVVTRDATLIVTASGIRHAFNGHGDCNKEGERGQICIENSDFELISNIVKNYDSVIRGNKSRAEESVVFIKTINKKTYNVVISVGKGKKGGKLIFNTMFIKK